MDDFKEQLIGLYKRSFDESDAYVDYFFRYRYKEENIVFVEREGRIISALHLLPQKIMIEGKARDAGFVSSAATLPEYRGKGVFFETMDKAYDVLKERGADFCVLYPFKHEYYKKHGFIEYSFVKRRVAGAGVMVAGTAGAVTDLAAPSRLKDRQGFAGRTVPAAGALKYTIEEYEPGNRKLFERIKESYEKACSGFEGWIVRDDKEWEYRLNEARADGGIVLVIKSENNITGYALTGRGKIEECCFGDFADEEKPGGYLIDGVKELAGMEYSVPLRAALRDAQDVKGATPFGMVKKIGCTAEQTFEFFKDKSCFLLDKY